MPGFLPAPLHRALLPLAHRLRHLWRRWRRGEEGPREPRQVRPAHRAHHVHRDESRAPPERRPTAPPYRDAQPERWPEAARLRAAAGSAAAA